MAKGIYRRGKVFWIRYAGLDGKTVFESSYSDKFRDAEDYWKTDYTKTIQSGRYVRC